jgi:hypothetical protein
VYSKEPVQQVLAFLAWKMHVCVAYHFNNNTSITILQIKGLRGHDLCYQLFVADIFVRFSNIMFLRLIGIPMATKSAALIADLFYTAICRKCMHVSHIILIATQT